MSHLQYMFLIQGILLFVMIVFIGADNIFINAIWVLQFFGHFAWATGTYNPKNPDKRSEEDED